ncbi:MAG: GAF domain-containing protein [Chroococcidiopsidaceae cyanobacterium CP_BM_RX_35]|nr:GAF domain-containing protein [Chroococcidiopsidaceae cyanobacterium CP_BM_RX_35]
MATLRTSADNQAEIAAQAAQFFSQPQTEIRNWNWVFSQPEPKVLSISSTPTQCSALSSSSGCIEQAQVGYVLGRLWILDDITERYFSERALVASTQKLSQANQELEQALFQATQVTEELRQQTQRAHQSEEQLRVALEELQRQNRRAQLFADVTLKIRQSLQLEEILQTTVEEVQKLLAADRVLIFRLQSNGFGQIVTEAVVPGWSSVIGHNILDDCFGQDYLKKYRQGRIYTITDIGQAQVEPCLIEFMQQFSVKAKLVMPILQKEELWGLLIAHQCAHPRQWSSFEIELLRQLADQIGIALAQAQLLEEETRQRQELARSNTELQQFAYVASHDLQEPLRKIQAFGYRLKEKYGELLSEQGRDYIERMQNAAERMQTLINDLLTLSRVISKAQPLVSVNLAHVAQEVLSDLEFQIHQTQGYVAVGELPTIEADPIQMRQLLQNLLSNALKFHNLKIPLVIKLYCQMIGGQGSGAIEHWQIIVEDNGIGFDEKYLDRIFNVFQRLHGRSEYDGTGMGLAICRKIAERHGGSITAKSQPGQGATFIVTLPSKQPRGETLS